MKISDLDFPILLDGGLSNCLEAMGCDLNHPLWTAKILQEDPEKIVKTHLDYLEAGARIITTASYQATLQGFQKQGISKEESIVLIKKSVGLARKAVDTFRNQHPDVENIFIAGSIGPYGAFLADGSEYRGDYDLTESELLAFHTKTVSLLDNEELDFLAFETVPSFIEMKAYSKLSENLKTKSWITFTCKDEKHISDGTLIRTCIEFLNDFENIVGVGVNCTNPNYISSLIKEINQNKAGQLLIIYPNSGEQYDPTTKSWSSETKSSMRVKEWLGLGVDIIGGCCRIGPEQIREINRVLKLGV